MLGNFSDCCSLLTFFKINFSKTSFRNSIKVSNSLDSGQNLHSVFPELGPNCLQRLSIDDKLPLVRKELISVRQAPFQELAFILLVSQEQDKPPYQFSKLH